MKNFLAAIKQIFPPYLLLLVFFPVLAGLLIDHNLVRSRDIVTNLVWLSVFTVPAAILGSRLLYRFAAFTWFIAGFFELAHWLISGGPLTVTSILVIFNTNFSEANEFLSLKASQTLLLLIPYVLIFYLVLRKRPQYRHIRYRYYYFAIFLGFSLIFIAENAIHDRLVRKGVPQTARMVFSFADQIHLYNEVRKKTYPEKVQATASARAENQTVVLILDESASRRHMSLYGYPRETNPLLSSRSDMFIFKDVVSPYSNTIQSVLSMLSESNLENGISFDESIDIIDVFHSAGFKTWWISNQPPMGIWENLVTVFANQADEKIFVNTTTNSSMEAIFTTSFDARLFEPLKNALNSAEPLKFIVLHLMGSHSAYNKRYPGSFATFSGNGKVMRTRAEYDNSRCYNDYVVDSLLNILKNHASYKKNSFDAAIWLSDHGENVFDELNRAGHDWTGSLPAANVEIPFVLWLSKHYEQKFPLKTKLLKKQTDLPFVADDLFHVLIDLANITTPYFKKERSIIHPEFDATRKRILEDGKQYILK